jgi:hypothetical protein
VLIIKASSFPSEPELEKMIPPTTLHIQAGRRHVLGRRAFLGTVAAGAAGLTGWNQLVAHSAEELRQRGMSCILLWMGGGPSQYESFDPKPGHACMGPTQTISSNVPGLRIGADWVRTANVMNEIAVIRSMVGVEPDHPRATFHTHTGYLPGGGVRYPTFGAVAAAEMSRTRPADFELPSFVAIGPERTPPKQIGAGFLPVNFAPLLVSNPTRLPANINLPTGSNSRRFERQIDLIRRLDDDYARAGNQKIVEDHRAVYDAARRLALSPRLRAFDINREPIHTLQRYGDSPFGQGCVLARRLVEEGIPFVEVHSYHPRASAGWDTHNNNFAVTKHLVDWVDPAYAALLTDLKERGMLDKTLVIWMGEFGRTAAINANVGRDHQQRAYTMTLAGGGVKGGRVLGATSADGTQVTERPVTVPDLFRTFCHSLGIDADKDNDTPIGRPVKIVDGGAPVRELF